MAVIDLHASDISCGHCKKSIEGDLAHEPGVRAVTVDIEDKRIDIDFDEAVTGPDVLKAKLDEIGYPAQ